jgi:hypothetical protein
MNLACCCELQPGCSRISAINATRNGVSPSAINNSGSARAVRSEASKTWHGVARFNPDACPPRRIFDQSRLTMLLHAHRKASGTCHPKDRIPGVKRQLKTILNRVEKQKGFVVSEARMTKAGEIEFTLRPRRGSRPICGSCGSHQQTFSYRMFLATPPQVPDVGVPTRPRIQQQSEMDHEKRVRFQGLRNHFHRTISSAWQPSGAKTNPQILLTRHQFCYRSNRGKILYGLFGPQKVESTLRQICDIGCPPCQSPCGLQGAVIGAGPLTHRAVAS